MLLTRRTVLAASATAGLLPRLARADDASRTSERALGKPDAKVVVHEYFSLTCTHCAHFSQTTMADVKAKLIDTGKIRYVFRDFPLDQVALTAAQVARAKALLAVADGHAFTEAAQAAGRKSGDAVGTLVAHFNAQGVAAVVPGHGGGPQPLYGVTERECILACARRAPDRERDGTATWSLSTLRQALRPEWPTLSTYTIWCVLHGAGLSWQKSRTWCQTGQVQRVRRRRDGTAEAVSVTDPDAEAEKS